MPLCDLIYLNNTSSVSHCQSPSTIFFCHATVSSFLKSRRIRKTSSVNLVWVVLVVGGLADIGQHVCRFPLHRSPNITMVTSCWVSRATRCWKYAQVKLTIIFPIVGGKQHNQSYHHLEWFSWVASDIADPAITCRYINIKLYIKSTEPGTQTTTYQALPSFKGKIWDNTANLPGVHRWECNSRIVWPVGHTGFAKDAPLHHEKEDWLPSFEAPGIDVQIPQKKDVLGYGIPTRSTMDKWLWTFVTSSTTHWLQCQEKRFYNKNKKLQQQQ